MEFISTRLPYRQTGAFTRIALDYIDHAEPLKPFFNHPPTLQGIRRAVEERQLFPTDRSTLVRHLKEQYSTVDAADAVNRNIDSLLSADTFTITTAHQNNIFSGPLFFIYKILHTIRLSVYLEESMPGNHFVPVFYMGTEDADLAELNHINLQGEKYIWETEQTGAVGRMQVDAPLLQLIDRMEGQLSVLPHGNELITLLRDCYKKGEKIQDATFKLVHALFGKYGLIVLLPDTPILKSSMKEIFRNELLRQSASTVVSQSTQKMEAAGYKVQAHPREINLFYLFENTRERIIQRNGSFETVDGKKSFSENELLEELEKFPERFSPNVILRGIYQESILPNIAFIGGAGETAYWLQLKDLFDDLRVPFPVLVLRNSFLVVEKKWQERLSKTGLTVEDLFFAEEELSKKIILHASENELKLNGSIDKLGELYESFKKQAAAVDSSLQKHVEALKLKSLHQLQELEKKMIRAEKRKFADRLRQVHTIREALFPGGKLQERHQNAGYFYALWGKDFIHQLYNHSLALEQEFVIVTEK